MTDKTKEALKLALEALETKSFDLHSEWGGPFNGETKLKELQGKAITAIREALAEESSGTEQLAQQQQEPVAYAVRTVGGKKWHSIHASKGSSDKWLEYRIKEQAQGETYEQFALYTSPPAQRKPLTDEETHEAIGTAGVDLLKLTKLWSDNKIHVYQFDNEARKIIKGVLHRAHGIKGDA